MQKGLQGKFKNVGDQMGEQFDKTSTSKRIVEISSTSYEDDSIKRSSSQRRSREIAVTDGGLN